MKSKSCNRAFAILLSLVLIIALLPTTVFATGSTKVTEKNGLSAALKDSEITEIHVAGNMTVYTGELNTDKTIVIDSGYTLTVSSASDFQTGNLIISDGATLKVVATSVSWPAHVYGTVENNGTILMTKQTDNGGNLFWHAKTTGTGICSTETCNKTVCIDYGAIPSEMFTAESTNYKINILKDSSKKATFSIDETDLIPGNTVTATIDNLVDGIDPAEVFKFQWTGNSTILSNEATCQIPIEMGGKQISVTASFKTNIPYVMVYSGSSFQTSITKWSGTVASVDKTTLYVDMINGNDSNAGTEDQPLKTLDKAIDNIAAGGTIFLIGDYDATGGYYVYSFLENITIKGSGAEKSTLTTWKETYIGDGVTVTFDNIDFAVSSDLFTKYPNSTGTGSLIFQNVSGGNISVSDLDSVTLKNSSLGSQNLQTNTLEMDESTLNGKFSCNDFVAKGNAALVLNGTGSIAKTSTVEQPVTVTPSSLANGTLVIEVPEESPEWADNFVLNDTENGKFALKCRTSTYGDPCLIVTEKLVAGGPLHVAFAPECSGDVVDKEPGKTYIDVPNEFYAAVTSAVWSGYSDIDGKTWQAGDIPELTVVMRTDISGTNRDSYYFAEDFDPSQFIIYDWQDLNQFAENFYKEEYQIDGVTAVVKTGQGVSDDGKTFTFTLQFPAVTHNLQKVDYKAPTCTAEGNEEYWFCKNCNKYFFDENATEETTLEQTIIPATGHNWGEPEWSWSEDGKTCTVTFTCENDETHKETPEVTVTSEVKTPATCTETGVTTYTATVEFNGKTYTDMKEVADIPATGHSYEDGKCTVCGAADPNYKPTEPGDEDTDSPQTGDSSNILLWVALLFLSGGALSAVTYKKKKQTN
ncbi:DUF1565 domain-containing protein [Phocea massiliensis]|uniref:DUF1565 domain-containing protein n=1 Tax=Merdimmobilis hominis TaxID=2897707 RepID=A0A938X7E6_9FIRM|nr:DUF1565 domain-containing protein [Merdimmobilis hominis]MBM6921872.1 DUF1565 domain-containing protein [Merdimmobilis hominis]